MPNGLALNFFPYPVFSECGDNDENFGIFILPKCP